MEKKKRVQKIFGEVLYEYRMTKNMKQAELAERSQMDETYISDLERGNYMPSLFTILKLANGLEIAVHKIIKKVEDKL